jgi:REP element-mobilizing transposase RayT
MPRQARLDLAGYMYHVIARGNERKSIFLEKEDYDDFLSRFKIALDKTGGKCLAWCLIPNHFHLLILRGRKPLAELMSRLATGYAVGFNIRHKRCGHLFQNRYKAIICNEEEYLRELVAYIHLNPLRANLVKDFKGLEGYKWCGHGAMMGTRKDGFIEREYILGHFAQTEHKAVQEYTAFLKERRSKYKGGEFSGGGLIKSMGGISAVLGCRKSGYREMFDERVLGNGDFVESVLNEAGELPELKIQPQEIMRQVCEMTGISKKEITGGRQERKVVRARAIYCYLAKEKMKLKGVDLMRELGLTCGAVSRLTERGRTIYEILAVDK